MVGGESSQLMNRKADKHHSLPPDAWCAWFSGLSDGEGSFCLTRNRGKWVRGEYRLNMRADDRPMLEEIKKTLGFGYIKRKNYAGRNPMTEFTVSHRKELLALVRLFDQFPLKSRKKNDYQVWRTFVILHQSRKGAGDAHVEYLLEDIRSAREFKEETDGRS